MRSPDNNFARLRKALMLQGEPDRVPVMELKVDPMVQEAFLGKRVTDAASEIEFWQKAGYDYVRSRPGYDFHAVGARAHVGRYNVYGDEGEQRNWAHTGGGVLRTDEDFDKYAWPRPEDIDYSRPEQISRGLPDGMKLITGCTGIWESVWMTMGFEGLSIAMADNPSLVERVFRRFCEIHMDIFRNAMELPNVGAMWYTDDMAYTEGLMVSPEVFRKHMFPCVKEMGELCRERDLPFILHSDGDLRPIMQDIIGCGFNAIHPIEPKAMDIRQLKRDYGDKLCLIGNIDLAFTLTRGTPSDVEEEVRQRIRDIAPGGGYCVSSSNSIPGYVPVENYRAMLEAVRTYGAYPVA